MLKQSLDETFDLDFTFHTNVKGRVDVIVNNVHNKDLDWQEVAASTLPKLREIYPTQHITIFGYSSEMERVYAKTFSPLLPGLDLDALATRKQRKYTQYILWAFCALIMGVGLWSVLSITSSECAVYPNTWYCSNVD